MILSWLSWLISVISLVLSFIYFYSRLKYTYWLRCGVPFLEPTFPYGNLEEVAVKTHLVEVYRKAYNQFKSAGKFVGIYFYMKPIAVITDLDLAKRILMKDFDLFPNRAFYYNEKHDPLSAHLVNVEDERWKNLRNKMTPTFASGKLKMMFSTVSNVVENLVAKIEQDLSSQDCFNVKDLFGRMTTDVIASCAFGIESNCLNDPDSEFFKMGQRAFEMKGVFSRVMRFGFPNLARKLGVRLFEKSMTNFYEGVTKDTIEYREKNNIERNDFMSLLIKMKNSVGKDHLTFDEIAAQSLIFYVAGHETTATTLTYCLYELSINLDVQEKARESVIETLKLHNNEISYAAMTNMTYLDQVINETLRKHPTVIRLSRVAKKNYLVPGTDKIIEKGTEVAIPFDAFQHDPEIYPDPDKFDPERFSPEEVSKRHPSSFLPFGEGPRVCIGLRFAMIEMKLTLTNLLMKYKFQLDRDKTPIPLQLSLKHVLVQPNQGVYVRVQKVP